MRIALITPFAMHLPGGVTQQVLGLRGELERSGQDVLVIAPGTPDHAAETDRVRSVGRSIPVHTNGAVAHVLLDPTAYGETKRLLGQAAVDLVHLHDPLTPLLPFIAFEAARRLDIPIVGTFHAYRDHRPWWTAPCLPYLRRLISGLQGRVAVSVPARDYAQMYQAAPIEVIPNGVDTLRFSPSAHAPEHAGTVGQILFVGRFNEPRKGLAVLLHAMEMLHQRMPKVRLTVIGPGDPERFRRRFGATSLQYTEFVGIVDEDVLPRYFRQSEVLCAPSTGGESFGLVVAQAMAAGLPVIASDIPGYASVLTHDREGWLVPPKDAVALVQAISALLDDHERRGRYGQAGRDSAARFAWPVVSSRVLTVYERAIATFRGDRLKAQRGRHVDG